jgi:hypothetical protein
MISMTGKRNRESRSFEDAQQSMIRYVCSDNFVKTINKTKKQNITNDVIIGDPLGIQLLQQGLKNINMLGLITNRLYYGNNVQYEQTAAVLFFDPDDFHPWIPNPEQIHFVERKYKACLSGFIKADKADKINKFIKDNTDKICIIPKIIPNKPSITGRSICPNSSESIGITNIYDIQSDNYIISTFGFSEKSYDDITRKYNRTISWSILDNDIFTLMEKNGLVENQDVVYMWIIDPVFGRKCYETSGLFEDVIRCLEKIDL